MVDINGNPIGSTFVEPPKITDPPTQPTDAVNKEYVDDNSLPVAGGTMTGPIEMSTNKITGLGTPTVATDAANKDYVDSAGGGGGDRLWTFSEDITNANSEKEEAGRWVRVPYNCKLVRLDTSWEARTLQWTAGVHITVFNAWRAVGGLQFPRPQKSFSPPGSDYYINGGDDGEGIFDDAMDLPWDVENDVGVSLAERTFLAGDYFGIQYDGTAHFGSGKGPFTVHAVFILD